MRFIRVLIFLGVCQISFGQITIRFEDKSKESIVGVKTQIKLSDGTQLKAISNELGKVSIQQQSKQYRIKAFAYEFHFIDTILSTGNHSIKLTSSVQEYDEVIVTAQYQNSSVEKAAHRIHVIGKDKIEAMAAINLKDVLSNELGVRLGQDNILGSSMSLQGLSGENIKILIDGVPVIGRLNGNIDLSQINLNEIERIEIVEGPLSVNYGTNALAGVINLITKRPSKNRISGSAVGYYESVGHFNFTGDVKMVFGNHGVGLTGGRNFFNGWHPGHKVFTNPEPIADSNRFMQWKPKEQVFGGVFYQWTKKSWFIRAKVDYFREKVWNRGYPRKPYFETAFDDEYLTGRLDNSLALKYRVKQKGLLNFLFTYNQYNREKNTYFIDLTTLERNITNNTSDHDTSVFQQSVLRGSYASTYDSSKINFQVGYDVLLENAKGRRIESGAQFQGDFAMYATAEYQPWKQLLIRPGIRYAYNTGYKTPILPSLNLKITPIEKFDVRLSYARGFRAPSIKELYFEFIDINHNIVGNESLLAETSHNILGAILYRAGKKDWKYQLEFSGFYNQLENRISLAQVDGTQFQYVNIGRFKSTGGRATFKISHKKLKFNLGFSYIGRADNISLDFKDGEFLFYPEVNSSISYLFPKSGTTLSLFYKYQGELPNYRIDSDGEVVLGRIQSYHLMDFTVSQKFLKKRLVLSAGVKNLLDVQQVNSTVGGGGQAHSSNLGAVSIGTGRTYFMSLKYQFNQPIKKKK